MEVFLKQEFKTDDVKDLHTSSGGCISDGRAFQINAQKIFIKTNNKDEADVMFEGEKEGLNEILKTNTVKVPTPIKVFKWPENGFGFAMEYLDLKNLRSSSSQLGTQLARLHMHNINKLNNIESNANRINDNENIVNNDGIYQFGFHATTCCGYIPLNNTWNNDWMTFYVRQRLEDKVNRIQEEYGDRQLMELWSELQLKIDQLFKGLEIQPSLIHGDLWGGNAGQLINEPVVFDPAAFYAHHEFELSITDMFGRFDTGFYKSYHALIPKAKGFEERHQLYILFHYLNHWNHFGQGYRSSSVSTMRKILKFLK